MNTQYTVVTTSFLFFRNLKSCKIGRNGVIKGGGLVMYIKELLHNNGQSELGEIVPFPVRKILENGTPQMLKRTVIKPTPFAVAINEISKIIKTIVRYISYLVITRSFISPAQI